MQLLCMTDSISADSKISVSEKSNRIKHLQFLFNLNKTACKNQKHVTPLSLSVYVLN